MEKSADAAKKMYTEKIDFVTKNLDQLQETIQKKQDNVRVVGDVMRMVSRMSVICFACRRI